MKKIIGFSAGSLLFFIIALALNVAFFAGIIWGVIEILQSQGVL